MNRRAAVSILAVALLSSACAAGGAASVGTRNIIAAPELAAAGDVDLYDALSSLRPTFLRSRPAPGTGLEVIEPTVYLDGVQMREGMKEVLKSLHARNIGEVRFLEANQANARFGGRNNGGALVVTSKK